MLCLLRLLAAIGISISNSPNIDLRQCRDIKLENTLLAGAWGDLNGGGSPSSLKLCDFQFAVAWGSEAHGHIDPHLG